MIATLLSMHYALLGMLSGVRAGANEWLSLAFQYLQRILPYQISATGSTAEHWLALRLEVVKALYMSHSTFERRRSFIEGQLYWTDDTGSLHE